VVTLPSFVGHPLSLLGKLLYGGPVVAGHFRPTEILSQIVKELRGAT
jgi:hypothetical protein